MCGSQLSNTGTTKKFYRKTEIYLYSQQKQWKCEYWSYNINMNAYNPLPTLSSTVSSLILVSIWNLRTLELGISLRKPIPRSLQSPCNCCTLRSSKVKLFSNNRENFSISPIGGITSLLFT